MLDTLGARVATLMRAQLAVALTVADGMQRYAVLTAQYGEGLIDAVGTIPREASESEGHGWDGAAARALAGYRDYVRELAALPGIASMHYYEQLGQLRKEAGVKPRSRTPTPAPTASLLALAAKIAAQVDSGEQSQQLPAQSKEKSRKKK